MKIFRLLTIFAISLMPNKRIVASPVDTTVIISNLVAKLISIKTLRYHYARELNYVKDNYFSKSEADCYIEFDGNQVSRFQMCSKNSIQIFNGIDYFSLNKSDKTYELTTPATQQMFSNFSYFYNSIPALRSVLADIVLDKSIIKAASDTIILNKNYVVLKLAMQNKAIGYLGSTMHFTKQTTNYYTIIIDPNTWLPICIIQRDSLAPDDFANIVYTAIDTNAVKPEASTWLLSTYLNEYKLRQKEKVTPLVTTGTGIGKWELPAFMGKNGSQIISSNSLNDKPVLLDFWIKNCGYCMESFVHLKDFQRRYGNKIHIVSINAFDPVHDVAFFYNREKPLYRMLYQGQALAKKLGIEDRGYPTVIILAKGGNVVYSGNFDINVIEKVLQNIL